MEKVGFKYSEGVIYVKASLTVHKHYTFKFLLDTGASNSVISKKVAEFIGFDLSKTKTVSAKKIATASGVIRPWRVTLKSFEALGRARKNYTVSVVNFPDDIEGVIGNDFLEKLGTVKIDYRAKEIETG